jgi:hypothetical protein
MFRQCAWSCVFLVLAGCGSQSYKGAKRYPLSGKVTYDGQPVDWGSIAFLPTSGDQRVSGGVIENGAYSVPEENGANAGKHRIEIHWLKLTGKKYLDRDSGEMADERKEALPPRFHTESTLRAEVGKGQTNFDFDLKSK